MNGVHLVIFDCDGTLVDSQHVIHAAMAEAFGSEGLVAPERERVRTVVGLQLDAAIARLAPDLAPSLVAALAERYKAAFFALRERPDPHEREPLFPGMAALVEALAGDGILLGVATGKSLRGLGHTLAMHGLDRYFVTLQTPDTSPGKPHPGMVLQAMAETGAAPRATVVVGDTSFDMEMASAAGVAGLGVAWGYHGQDELRSAGARAVAADGAVLAALIDASLGRGP